jgi:hypothetical protein
MPRGTGSTISLGTCQRGFKRSCRTCLILQQSHIFCEMGLAVRQSIIIFSHDFLTCRLSQGILDISSLLAKMVQILTLVTTVAGLRFTGYHMADSSSYQWCQDCAAPHVENQFRLTKELRINANESTSVRRDPRLGRGPIAWALITAGATWMGVYDR